MQKENDEAKDEGESLKKEENIIDGLKKALSNDEETSDAVESALKKAIEKTEDDSEDDSEAEEEAEEAEEAVEDIVDDVVAKAKETGASSEAEVEALINDAMFKMKGSTNFLNVSEAMNEVTPDLVDAVVEKAEVAQDKVEETPLTLAEIKQQQ